MVPVSQSKLYCADGIHNGNCMAACLASLLEIPLWMVPPFEDMFGREDSYINRRSEWLHRMFGKALCRVDGHHPEQLPEFYIASGPAARGVYHSVIYQQGHMVHDPHPSNGGLSVVEWTWHLSEMSST